MMDEACRLKRIEWHGTIKMSLNLTGRVSRRTNVLTKQNRFESSPLKSV